MQKESAIIDLLSGQQRAWRARFPSLANRAHQTIIGYLCTRGRAGVPVRQIYGVTKELYLLDDATVRERVEDIERLGLCEATPKGVKLTGRTIVAPTESLLATFDTYLLAVCDDIRTAMQHVDPSLSGPPPAVGLPTGREPAGREPAGRPGAGRPAGVRLTIVLKLYLFSAGPPQF